MKPPRTRFAPSPTGTLHVGNVRIAVFNWLFARANGGEFIVRIEDTDIDRNATGSEEAILTDLRWLALDWDEGPDIGGRCGPYRQSERSDLYREAVDQLIVTGAAYYAESDVSGEGIWRELTQSEAAKRRAASQPVHVRFRGPVDGHVSIQDAVRGAISFPSNDIGDFVILREDGRPTYHLAVVVDDWQMEITHVIRGAGHLSNTPKHALLFDALGADRPVFVHLPTVLNKERKKLSKRTGAPAVSALRDEGVPPDAVVNYLSLLGWSAPGDEEVFARDRLLQLISLERIDASDTIFDPTKLMWLAGKHIAALSAEEIVAEAVARTSVDDLGIPEALLPVAVEAIRTRLHTFGQIRSELAVFCPDEGLLAGAVERLRSQSGIPELLNRLADDLEELEEWRPREIEVTARGFARTQGVKVGELFHPLREVIIGNESGPSVGAILTVVGRVQVLERLRSVARGL